MNSHLNGLGVENFRVFKEKTWLDFAPITILTGTNSSGKSTMVKAANLLQNFFERRTIKTNKNESPDVLDIEELLDVLGDFTKLPNYRSDNQTIFFYLPIVLRGIIDKLQLKLEFKLQEGTLKQGKLTGMSIHSQKNESAIFSITEIETLKYNIAINYLFFFEEYKRESSKIKEYEFNESQYFKYNSGDSVTCDDGEFNFLSKSEKEKRADYFLNQRSVIHPEYYSFKYNPIPKNKDYNYRPFFKYNHDNEIELFFEFKYNNVFYSPDEVLFQYKNDDYETELKIKNQVKKENEFLKQFQFTLEYISDEDAKNKYELDLEINNSSANHNIFENNRERNSKYELEKKSFIKNYTLFWCPLMIINEGRLIKDDNNKCYKLFEFSKDKFIDNEIVNLISSSDGFQRIVQPHNIEKEGVSEDEKYLSMSEFFFNYFVAYNLNYSITEAFSIFENTNYISTFRNQSKRSYSVNQGDQLASIVKRIIEAEEDLDNVIYFAFVNKYLSVFEIGSAFQITRTAEGQDYIYINKMGEETLLADLGYGVSQVLPLLLQICLTALNNPNADAKLFIEEPETNLHPALQAKLADMFVEAGKSFNIQFIIETHSEYLIRKLQYLTAKEEIKTDDTVIYYFYPAEKVPEGEKQAKKINIQEDGSLSDEFGSGFFDEADNIALELFLLKKNQYN